MYGCAFRNIDFTTSFCITFLTSHLQCIKQTLRNVKISNFFNSNLSPLLSLLFPIGQLFKSPPLPNRINSQNLNTLFLLVYLRNTVPLSYWSIILSLSLTLYPSKLLYKTTQSIKYKILTTNKIKPIITVTFFI